VTQIGFATCRVNYPPLSGGMTVEILPPPIHPSFYWGTPNRDYPQSSNYEEAFSRHLAFNRNSFPLCPPPPLQGIASNSFPQRKQLRDNEFQWRMPPRDFPDSPTLDLLDPCFRVPREPCFDARNCVFFQSLAVFSH